MINQDDGHRLGSSPDNGSEPGRTSLRGQICFLLNPDEIEAKVINEFDPPEEIPRTGDLPDWNKYPMREKFREEFDTRLKPAKEMYLQLPAKERIEIFGDLLLGLFPTDGPISQGRCDAVQLIIGYGRNPLPADVRERILPRAKEVFAANIRIGDLASPLTHLFRETDLEDDQIFDAYRFYLIEHLEKASVPGDDRTGWSTKDSVYSYLSRRNSFQERVIADPVVAELSKKYIDRQLVGEARSRWIINEAEELGIEDYLKSPEFNAKIEARVKQALQLDGSSLHVDEDHEIPVPGLEGALHAARLLPWHDQATDEIPKTVQSFLSRVAADAELAIVSTLENKHAVERSMWNPLFRVKSAIEVFATKDFKESSELGNALVICAQNLPSDHWKLAEFAEELLLFAPANHIEKIRETLARKVCTQVKKRVATVSKAIAGTTRRQRNTDYEDSEVTVMAELLVALGGDLELSPKKFISELGLALEDFHSLKAPFQRELRRQIATRKTKIEQTHLAEAAIESDGPLSLRLARALRVIGVDREENITIPGQKSTATSLAEKISVVHNPPRDGIYSHNSPRFNVAEVAFDLADEDTAQLFPGLSRRILFQVSDRLRSQLENFPDSVEEKEQDLKFDEGRDDTFYEMRSRFNLFYKWNDPELAGQTLVELRVSYGSSPDAKYYAEELLTMQERYAKLIGDRAQLVNVQRAELDNISDEDLSEYHLNILLNLSHYYLHQIPTPDFNTVESMLERALKAEEAIESSHLEELLDSTAADLHVSPSVTAPIVARLRLALVRLALEKNETAEELLAETLENLHRLATQTVPNNEEHEDLNNFHFHDSPHTAGTICELATEFVAFEHVSESIRMTNAAIELQEAAVNYYKDLRRRHADLNLDDRLELPIALADMLQFNASLMHMNGDSGQALARFRQAICILDGINSEDASSVRASIVEQYQEVHKFLYDDEDSEID